MNHVATTTRSQWSPNYGMRRAPRKLEKIWLSNRYHALPSSLQKCPIARPHVPTFAWLQGARLMCLRKCFYLSLLFLFVLLYQRGNAKSTARATSCKRHFVGRSGNPALPEAKKKNSEVRPALQTAGGTVRRRVIHAARAPQLVRRQTPARGAQRANWRSPLLAVAAESASSAARSMAGCAASCASGSASEVTFAH